MVIFKNILILMTCLLLWNNVESNEIPESDKVKPTVSSSDSMEKIEFYDSEIFDMDLGKLLQQEPVEIEVAIVSPFSLNDVPERIDKWLVSIKEYKGDVSTKPDPDYPKRKMRGIISGIVDLVMLTYGAIKEYVIYGAAENYNVTLYYMEGRGSVTKIIFTHK
jgi:hypothetical protein